MVTTLGKARGELVSSLNTDTRKEGHRSVDADGGPRKGGPCRPWTEVG